MTTVAGTGFAGRGADGVPATASELNYPSALAVDAHDDLYIADWQNYLIRKVTFTAVGEGGIVNGASFTTPVAPGSIVSIFGSSLAGTTALAADVPLPATLGGVSVEVNGTAIPLFFVTPGQINAQLPYDLEGDTASLSIVTAGGRSKAAAFPVVRSAPGIFTDGTGRAVAQNQDFTLNSPANAEARGRVVVLYVTGLGAVEPPAAAGQSASLNFLSPATGTVSATVGGVNAQVIFAGLAPGLVGAGQVNILLPPESGAGADVPVVIAVDGQKSRPAAISVR